MDGSQEQPCAIAGGQGQCEGRQAQRGPSWRAMLSPPGGFAQSLGEICSQANQSATSGSFFGTKYWKCAESDAGNPKKSMILHRMVPSDSAKSVLIDLSLPPLPNSAFWRPFRTQKVRPAAAVDAPRA